MRVRDLFGSHVGRRELAKAERRRRTEVNTGRAFVRTRRLDRRVRMLIVMNKDAPTTGGPIPYGVAWIDLDDDQLRRVAERLLRISGGWTGLKKRA